jgi:hypothetical protein
MPILLVGYDLNRPGQHYSELIDAIKDAGAWWHHLDSTWFVKSSLSAQQLRDRLAAHIDSGDELLVLDVTGDGWAGTGFEQRAFDWLRSNL